jgi:hypothetical protein
MPEALSRLVGYNTRDSLLFQQAALKTLDQAHIDMDVDFDRKV